jgi:hypothetical protein
MNEIDYDKLLIVHLDAEYWAEMAEDAETGEWAIPDLAHRLASACGKSNDLSDNYTYGYGIIGCRLDETGTVDGESVDRALTGVDLDKVDFTSIASTWIEAFRKDSK